MYSASGPFTKNQGKIQKIKDAGDLQFCFTKIKKEILLWTWYGLWGL